MVAAEARVSEVAGLVRGLERTMHQGPASLDMSGPGQDDISENQIGSGLKPPQSASFNQFITKPPELKSGLVVTKERTSDRAKPYIGAAGAVAVTALEA